MVTNSSRYGTLKVKNNQIVKFIEKQQLQVPGIISLGCYLINDLKIFDDCPSDPFSFENQLELWTQKNTFTIGNHLYSGPFIDIGIPSDYQKMIDLISSAYI